MNGHNLRIPTNGDSRIEIDRKAGIARIKLVNAESFTTVDIQDVERVSAIRWRLAHPKRGVAYVVGTVHGMRDVSLHRFLMGLDVGDPRNVDHVDRDRLNNTRENLRLCTVSENARNAAKHTGQCTSVYKGVSWDKATSKWQAKITKNWKQMRLGRFDSEIDAARAYDEAARELFGEFAYLNFPDT